MENNKLENQATDQNQETIFTPDEFSLKGYDKHIRQARNAIFAVAILLVLNLVILCFTIPDEYEYLWIDITLWSVFIAGFVALGFWTKKKPYYAILGAICLYLVFIGLNAFFDITTLYKGIIFKVIVIVLLFKGINDAKEAQALQKTFDK
jgi:diacylglycerol kinase